MRCKQLPAEALVDLRRRLAGLTPRSAERRAVMQETSALYGLSESSLYRALRQQVRPKALQRADRGMPRILPRVEFERFCEVIAALKIRTTNKKGRHLSTVQAIWLLEEHGVETPDGLLRAPKDVLSRSTVNRYLKQWGFDYATLTRVPAAATRPAPMAVAFVDPDPFREISYPNPVAAKRAIADYLNVPLAYLLFAKVPAEAMDQLDAALADSLRKADVIDYARINLKPLLRG